MLVQYLQFHMQNSWISWFQGIIVQLYHVQLGIFGVNNVFYVYLYMEAYVSIVYMYITHVYVKWLKVFVILQPRFRIHLRDRYWS